MFARKHAQPLYRTASKPGRGEKESAEKMVAIPYRVHCEARKVGAKQRLIVFSDRFVHAIFSTSNLYPRCVRISKWQYSPIGIAYAACNVCA